MLNKIYNYSKKDFNKIYSSLSNLVINTPLEYNLRLSKKYNCNLYLKREDLQNVRSFKIRGAYNKMLNLTEDERKRVVVCASAGNHAQGVALSARHLGISCDIYIPNKTPLQKIDRIKHFGDDNCNVIQYGNDLTECLDKAVNVCLDNNKEFIHPYNDENVIIGQATVAKEIYDIITPDVIVGSVGGGGLLSGISIYSNHIIKNPCDIVGVEPESCPSLEKALINNNPIKTPILDTFVDGATVNRIGDLNFEILRDNINYNYSVPIGLVCESMLDLYKEDGIITEPAGALSVSCLSKIPPNVIENKNVVCVISGGNNDISRYPEIVDRYLEYQGLKHYYIVQFAQKPEQLKDFINKVLPEGVDIVRFEYIKKTNKQYGNVLIGIELKSPGKIDEINNLLENNKFEYVKLNKDELLYSYLV